MKVTDVQAILVHPYSGSGEHYIEDKNWLFVKVETDEGITGWGESYTMRDRDLAQAQFVKELGRYLIGRDPFHIKHFSQLVYNDFGGRRGGIELFCALSGIEQALWDVVGKKLDTPVYNLLGGPCRDRIRAYANGWTTNGSWNSAIFSPGHLRQAAIDTVKMGFTALKFEPFPGPMRSYVSRQDEKTAVENVRIVREAVGPDIDILVEVHRRLSPMSAIRVAKEMAEFKPFWYEEPVPVENVDALAEVRSRIDLPIVTGETLCTKVNFREVLAKRAADILNPDVSHCGGILELKEIAAMAEANYVAVCPHNHNSTTVSLAATLQVAAMAPNFLITEYFVNFKEKGNEILETPFELVDGHFIIPTGPGLGITINEDALANLAFSQSSARKFRTVSEELL
ncbi:MAG: mandelate racemase/muconate lactonizing enzyme family protein [Desulfosporosinus sp.]|nr:mandelate racemase/muconate lactonizing enzyme family protein [Desulfosporosinus sp.]